MQRPLQPTLSAAAVPSRSHCGCSCSAHHLHRIPISATAQLPYLLLNGDCQSPPPTLPMSRSSTFLPRGSRPYDIIVWGATGYTGALVCRHLAQHSATSQLTFAIAGRSFSKLTALASRLTSHSTSTLTSPRNILTANLSSPDSLTALTNQCRVLIAAAGPFAQYGEPILAACITTETCYTDITGEVPWVRSMMEKYQALAQSSRVLLLPMSGVDSLPSELCAVFALESFEKRHGVPLRDGHLQTYVRVKASVSGGTAATMLQSTSRGMRGMNSPYQLTLPGYAERKAQQGVKEGMQLLPSWSSSLHTFTAPFIMAAVNSQAVRRTLSFIAQHDGDKGKCERVTYSECMVPSRSPLVSLLLSIAWSVAIVTFFLLTILPPTRELLRLFVPSAGQGPSDKERHLYHYTWTTTAQEREGTRREVTVEMRGGEMYEETARLVAEVAGLVVKDGDKWMAKVGGGGFGSVGYMMGEELRARMQSCGTTFRVVR